MSNALGRTGSQRSMNKKGEKIVVALNASKEITKHALEWALNNVTQPGDHIILLALLRPPRRGRRIWGWPKLAGDCASVVKKGQVEGEINDSCSLMMQRVQKLCDSKKAKVSVRVVGGAEDGKTASEAKEIGATWVVLDRQLKKEGKYCLEQLGCNIVIVNHQDAKILRLNLKGSSSDVGARLSCILESNSTSINGDDQLKHNSSQANSNSSIATSSSPPFSTTEPGNSMTPTSSSDCSEPQVSSSSRNLASSLAPKTRKMNTAKHVKEMGRSHVRSDSDTAGEVSDYESDEGNDGDDEAAAVIGPSTSGRLESKMLDAILRNSNKLLQEAVDFRSTQAHRERFLRELRDSRKVRAIPNSNLTLKPSSHLGVISRPTSPLDRSRQFLSQRNLLSNTRGDADANADADEETNWTNVNGSASICRSTRHNSFNSDMDRIRKRVGTAKDLLEKFAQWDAEMEVGVIGAVSEGKGKSGGDLERMSSIRKAMLLSKNMPPGPPPLCSICRHKTPVFGKPPRRFSFKELENATRGFSQANFLAEGGFGSVHMGVLPNGQAVAVKQHKLASSQGDLEFCAEVEVLSCAQHRNVVMLIGYCIEDKRRLLVYEFVCNGSLDSHLYGKGRPPLEWSARQKIAVGAARGLRYLHEECRVGCIVHRDLRPNNILLTHDFEPMVGDFGLARWQPDGEIGVQTRVIGTFGYLAPEYAQSGQITEKADVYSLGVVLLELVTGRKAVDMNRTKGQQCLTEWARPLLDEHAIQEMVDPALEGWYTDYEVYCMLHAASLCIRKDPLLRPRMSQVLRILEGDVIIDTSGSSTPPCSGKLTTFDPCGYGSQSCRMPSEFSVNHSGILSPQLASHSGKLCIGGELHQQQGYISNNKFSHEAMKAAYRDRVNTQQRLSYEDLIRLVHG